MVELLSKAVQMGGSDIFIIPGAPPRVKVNSSFKNLAEDRLLPADSERLVQEMYELAHRDFTLMDKEGDDDFSFAVKNVSRFRCNAYHQRGTVAAICRIVNFELPDPATMSIPPIVMELASQRSGMILAPRAAARAPRWPAWWIRSTRPARRISSPLRTPSSTCTGTRNRW